MSKHSEKVARAEAVRREIIRRREDAEKSREEESKRREDQSLRRLHITCQAQRDSLSTWIESIHRRNPTSDLGEFDDAFEKAGAEPHPEPLEGLANELKQENAEVRKDIGEALHEIFGIKGMKVVLFRACNRDSGLYYRLTGAFNGIGNWQC